MLGGLFSLFESLNDLGTCDSVGKGHDGQDDHVLIRDKEVIEKYIKFSCNNNSYKIAKINKANNFSLLMTFWFYLQIGCYWNNEDATSNSDRC